MDKKSTAIAYSVGVFLGSVGSVGILTFWLETSPFLLSILTGGIFSIVGVSMRENIGEAIVFSLIVSVLTAVLFQVEPEISFLKKGIIPAVVGLCIGKMVIGIDREVTGD